MPNKFVDNYRCMVLFSVNCAAIHWAVPNNDCFPWRTIWATYALLIPSPFRCMCLPPHPWLGGSSDLQVFLPCKQRTLLRIFVVQSSDRGNAIDGLPSECPANRAVAPLVERTGKIGKQMPEGLFLECSVSRELAHPWSVNRLRSGDKCLGSSWWSAQYTGHWHPLVEGTGKIGRQMLRNLWLVECLVNRELSHWRERTSEVWG